MEIRYNKATIRINGNVDREKLEEATIMFMSKVMKEIQNGNDNKTRTIKEK